MIESKKVKGTVKYKFNGKWLDCSELMNESPFCNMEDLTLAKLRARISYLKSKNKLEWSNVWAVNPNKAKIYTYKGVTGTSRELLERFGNEDVTVSCFNQRIRKGYSIERALTQPIKETYQILKSKTNTSEINLKVHEDVNNNDGKLIDLLYDNGIPVDFIVKMEKPKYTKTELKELLKQFKKETDKLIKEDMSKPIPSLKKFKNKPRDYVIVTPYKRYTVGEYTDYIMAAREKYVNCSLKELCERISNNERKRSTRNHI